VPPFQIMPSPLAPILISWNRSWARLNDMIDISDGTALSVDGRVFQVRAEATENARSPSVDRRVDGMTRVDVAADRR